MTLKKTSILVVSIIAVFALAASQIAWGARTDFETQSLHGLDGVYVIVQSLNPDIVKDGLTATSIESSVKQQLKDAGIKVLADKDSLSSDDGILLLELSSIKSNSGFHACSLDAELIQVARLARDTSIITPATTWMSGVVAVVTQSNVSHITDIVTELVGEFVKDYQSANSTSNTNKSGAGPAIDSDGKL
ncbi:MAG: hypothetical protein ABFD54_09450 [Armatimonadota bacterium]|nr:hypothetical protein [bacterium]